MMRFHPRVLEAAQARLLGRIGSIAATEGFYLGGDTAIALQLGHRMSDDFDWFREQAFDPLELAAQIRTTETLEITTTARDTLWGTIDGVKTSFFRFRFPLLKRRVRYPRFGCQLASLPDLVAMKLNAISRRGSRKDFIDLYSLGRVYPLGKMLGFYRTRFATENVGHLLYSLTYFVDAENDPMPRMLRDVSWEDVKTAVTEWAVHLL